MNSVGEIVRDLERMLKSQHGTVPVFNAMALRKAIASLRELETLCALSWDGKNVHGDSASIDAVKTALHEAGTVPELKSLLRAMQDALNDRKTVRSDQIYCIEYISHGITRKKYIDLDKVVSAEIVYEDEIIAKIVIVAQLLENPIVIGSDLGRYAVKKLSESFDAFMSAWKSHMEGKNG